MFYSQFILAKKGPLGTIWIAAHLERKLRKNQITETNISASVDSILFPEVPIALRLSGHLLLGVVRIYSRKVNYLFHDCSEALVKIKHAFHSSAVDLPPESSTAPFHSITLPETFDFDELEVFLKRDKGIQAAVRGIVDHNVSERDLITLREQDAQAYRSSLFTLDERFPESGDPYSLLDYHDEQHVRDELQNCTGSASASLMQENCGPSLEEDVLPPLQMDDEMDFEKANIDEAAVFQKMVLDEVATPLMHTNLQDTLIPEPGAEQLRSPSIDAHVANGSMSVTEMLQIPDVERLRSVVEPQEHEPFFMELDDELGHKNDAVDLAEHKEGNAADDLGTHVEEPTPVLKETPVSSRPSPLTAETYADFHGSDDLLATILGGRTPALKMIGTPSEVVASVKDKRGQRKRKHVLDDSIALSSMIMKKQLTDTADLCRKRRRTPLTKFQARKMQGSYNDEKFASPSFPGLCIDIKELYSSVVSLSSSKPVVKPSPHKLGNAKACEGFQEEALEAAEPNDLYNGMMENNATPEPLRADFQEVLQAAEPFPNATLSDGLFEQASENLTFLADSNETLQAAAEPLPNSASSEDLSEQALKNQTFLGDSEDRDQHNKMMENNATSELRANFQEKALGAAERLPKTASAEDLSEQGLETATFPAGSKDALQAAEPLPNAASSEDVCEQALENLTFLADSKDKVFLAADEEANLEETDVNYHRKGKTVQDKSGWSLRTKAVAEYLKPLFEKLESTPVLDAGPSKLSLDSLLKRRSRKEAARMFFEILVLKSKEYVHVDQSTGFADIMLSSTHLLRKEVF